MKKLIRLTEADMHKIIKESVINTLNEMGIGQPVQNNSKYTNWKSPIEEKVRQIISKFKYLGEPINVIKSEYDRYGNNYLTVSFAQYSKGPVELEKFEYFDDLMERMVDEIKHNLFGYDVEYKQVGFSNKYTIIISKKTVNNDDSWYEDTSY